MNLRTNEEYLKVSYLDLSRDTLFSSVVATSASNTVTSNLKLNNQPNSLPPAQNGLMRCLSLSSLLDPNVDLPNISARDVDDVLSVSNNWKIKRESSLPSVTNLTHHQSQTLTEFEASNHIDSKDHSINLEEETITVDDEEDKVEKLAPLTCRVDSFSDLFTSTNEDLQITSEPLITRPSNELQQLIETNVEVVEDEEEIIVDKEPFADSFSTVFVENQVDLYDSTTEVINNSNANFSTIVNTIYETPANDNKIQVYDQSSLLPDLDDDEEVNVVHIDDVEDKSTPPIHFQPEVSNNTFPVVGLSTSYEAERNGGGSECGYNFDSNTSYPKRCTSAPIPFWQDDFINSLDEMTCIEIPEEESIPAELNDNETQPICELNNDNNITKNHDLISTVAENLIITNPLHSTSSEINVTKYPDVMIIRESDILKSEELKNLFSKLKPINQVENRIKVGIASPCNNSIEGKMKIAETLLPSCAASGVVNFNANFLNQMNNKTNNASLDNPRKRKFTSTQAAVNRNLDERYKYMCPHRNCEKRFIVEERLIHHRTNYHNELLVKCSMQDCNEKFANEKDKKIHLEKCHPDQYTPYRCDECQMNFSRLALLRKHKQNGHLSQLYTCQHCGKIFINESRMEKHQSRHSQENIFKCPHLNCEKTFLFAAHLNKHLKNIHNEPLVASSLNLQTNQVELSQRLDVAVNTPSDHGLTVENRPVDLIIHPANSDQDKGINSPSLRVIYSCPIKDCNSAFDHKSEFHEHFVKHFTGEVPGDLNSLLPEDLPSTEEGMELPSMTFDANVGGMQGNQLMQEGSSLLDALDLILAETIDLSNKTDSSSQQLLVPDLTSALTLPALQLAGMHRNKQKTGNVGHNNNQPSNHNQYHSNSRTTTVPLNNQNSAPSSTRVGNDQSRPNFQLTGCARTCPVTNNVMSSLVKRRRALLRERITLGYEPLPLMDNQLALKDVMRQIFHSKELPVKYKDTHSELNKSFKKQQ